MNKIVIFLALLASILGAFLYLAVYPDTSYAQNNDSGQALEIAPPVVTISAEPGQTIKTQISLRDVSSSPLIVTSQINDFVAAGEDGTPKILMDGEEEQESPFSLRGWIDPLPQLRLKPQEIKNLPVTVRVPANASPGGYYGVVRFTAVPPELEGTGVSLSASLGSLLLVTVKGDAKIGMEVESFTATKDDKENTIFESTPITFVQRLKNTGNIHLQPAGQVAVTDMFGKKIAAVNINLPPGNVLPQSIRKFSQPLDKSVLGNKKLFGRYTAELRVVYGPNKQQVTEKISFWVIPYKLIGIMIAILIIGFIVLRITIKRYNAHIINQARGGRK